VALTVANCGQEEIPVACSPEADECETRTEGGFQTGPTAGIAAGVAAVAVIVSASTSHEGNQSPQSNSAPNANDTDLKLNSCNFNNILLPHGSSTIT